MSYFAFGLLWADDSSLRARANVLEIMRRCATSAGLAVALGGEGEPPILSEMRGAFSAEIGIPFLCLAQPEDDTSDRLISPHLRGVGGACDGARIIAKWIDCVINGMRDARMVIWFTEGFDDAFERHDCRVEEVEALLVARFREENEVPSILLNINPK